MKKHIASTRVEENGIRVPIDVAAKLEFVAYFNKYVKDNMEENDKLKIKFLKFISRIYNNIESLNINELVKNLYVIKNQLNKTNELFLQSTLINLGCLLHDYVKNKVTILLCPKGLSNVALKQLKNNTVDELTYLFNCFELESKIKVILFLKYVDRKVVEGFLKSFEMSSENESYDITQLKDSLERIVLDNVDVLDTDCFSKKKYEEKKYYIDILNECIKLHKVCLYLSTHKHEGISEDMLLFEMQFIVKQCFLFNMSTDHRNYNKKLSNEDKLLLNKAANSYFNTLEHKNRIERLFFLLSDSNPLPIDITQEILSEEILSLCIYYHKNISDIEMIFENLNNKANIFSSLDLISPTLLEGESTSSYKFRNTNFNYSQHDTPNLFQLYDAIIDLHSFVHSKETRFDELETFCKVLNDINLQLTVQEIDDSHNGNRIKRNKKGKKNKTLNGKKNGAHNIRKVKKDLSWQHCFSLFTDIKGKISQFQPLVTIEYCLLGIDKYLEKKSRERETSAIKIQYIAKKMFKKNINEKWLSRKVLLNKLNIHKSKQEKEKIMNAFSNDINQFPFWWIFQMDISRLDEDHILANEIEKLIEKRHASLKMIR